MSSNTLLRVDIWVEEHARDPIERFYPSLVSEEVDLPVNIVFNRLLALSRQGKLELLLEIHCPECKTKLGDYTTSGGIPKVLECVQCKHVFSVDVQNVFPAFKFTKEYSEIKKKFSRRKEHKDGEQHEESDLYEKNLSRHDCMV